ncbi:MAG: succinate dehydrogenase, cytochrome b556 subunit [Reinekea sp.]
MKNNRPVNLDLSTIRMPISAIASITHRITGVGLFVAIGFLLWALNLSLESEAGFEQVKGVMTNPLAKFIAWGIASFVFYHLVAGIKHLCMDAGHLETKEGGAAASKFVFGLSALGIILLGVWIW